MAFECEKSASALIAASTPRSQNASCVRSAAASPGVTARKQHPHSTHSWSIGLPLAATSSRAGTASRAFSSISVRAM